jgi:hypothetical protein
MKGLFQTFWAVCAAKIWQDENLIKLEKFWFRSFKMTNSSSLDLHFENLCEFLQQSQLQDASSEKKIAAI